MIFDVIMIFFKNHLKLLVIIGFLLLTGFASSFTTMWDRAYTAISTRIDMNKVETKFNDVKNGAVGLINKIKK